MQTLPLDGEKARLLDFEPPTVRTRLTCQASLDAQTIALAKAYALRRHVWWEGCDGVIGLCGKNNLLYLSFRGEGETWNFGLAIFA